MKKIIALGAIALMTAFAGNNVKAQGLEQGNSVIDVYHGFPNILNALLRVAYDDSFNDVEFSNIGPIGIRYE